MCATGTCGGWAVTAFLSSLPLTQLCRRPLCLLPLHLLPPCRWYCGDARAMQAPCRVGVVVCAVGSQGLVHTGCTGGHATAQTTGIVAEHVRVLHACEGARRRCSRVHRPDRPISPAAGRLQQLLGLGSKTLLDGDVQQRILVSSHIARKICNVVCSIDSSCSRDSGLWL